MKRNTRRSSVALNFPSLEKRLPAGSFSTKFSIPSLVRRLEKLTKNQRDSITRAGFGSLLNLRNQLISKNLLVELMDRWDCDNLAFKLLPGDITITLNDVALILGLRVIGKPVLVDEDETFSDLEQEYGATASNRKISLSSIEERLESIGEIASEDFIRTFLLFAFGTFLFPTVSGKLDSRYLSFLKDLDKVNQFAWGEAVLQDLFKWLTKRKEDNVQYVGGCLLLLQIWSYEHIDIGRANLLDGDVNFPRACRWESSRASTQRQRFGIKFNELEEDQIIWVLEPLVEESQIDVVIELIESESLGEMQSTERPSTSSTSLVELSELTNGTKSTVKELDKSIVVSDEDVDRAESDVQEYVSESCESETSARNQREPLEDLSCSKESLLNELVNDSESVVKELDKKKIDSDEDMDRAESDIQEYVSDSCERTPQSQREPLEELSCSKESLVNVGQINTPKDIFDAKNAEWYELSHLRKDNAQLREEIARLKEEAGELRRENERLRKSPDDLADRLDRLLDEYDEGNKDQS